MPALRTRDLQSRTLDVTTDAPAPTLNIVSPTPRAFTFPIAHNLSDSPYASPSASPDLRSIPTQLYLSSPSSSPIMPPTVNMRSLTPDDSHPSLKRRKSSSDGSDSEPIEHRPKKGDQDYIKRPENAFILFRRKCCEDRQAAEDAAHAPTKKQRQADLSKTISQQWKGLTQEERNKWEDLAKSKKAEHERKYPGYVYRPQRAKDKDGRTKNNRRTLKSMSTPTQFQYEGGSVSFVVPVLSRHHHGRSASAPTPPPFQSVQVPNVYMTPSCPTSPSLLPMISRRSAHPGHQDDVVSSSFDYLPNNSNNNAYSTYNPMPGQFEASLQSSEFLRGMFSSQRSSAPELQDLSFVPQHVSPHSSASSSNGSSSPSSPTAPFTPTSFLPSSQDYAQLAPVDAATLEAQAQAEMDLQLEMQIQQEFASFNWGDSAASIWDSPAAEGVEQQSMLLGEDFNIHAIRPVELGLNNLKYTENVAIIRPYGQEYVSGGYPHEEERDMSLAFDDMMAGHSF